MEFFFTNHLAHIESAIFFICITIGGVLYFSDKIRFILKKMGIISARKEYTMVKSSETKESGAIEEEKVEAIENYLAEKGEIDTERDKIIHAEDPYEDLLTDDIPTTSPETPLSETEIPEKNDLPETVSPEQIETTVPELLETEEKAELPERKKPLELPKQEEQILLEAPEEEKLLEAPVEEKLLPLPEETKLLPEQEKEQLLEAPTEEKILSAPEKQELLEEPSETTETPDKTIATDEGVTTSENETLNNPAKNTDQETAEEETVPSESKPETHQESPEPQKNPSNTSLSSEQREKLTEILSTVQTLLARGQTHEARSLVISGLAIQKEHKELNMILASLYEKDHEFTKAELIYKDLAKIWINDPEVLLALANNLAMQRKYEVAYEFYKKVLELRGETEEVLYTITHVSAELSLPEETHEYARAYLKRFPKNPEILWLFSQTQVARGDRKGAIETLIKIKNLTPYNPEILEVIQKLVTEEELAQNFNAQN